LGKLLLGHVRGEDIACRYGGDEFIIVLPDTAREVTYERAELICEFTKQLHLQYEGQTLEAVSFCVGVAVFPQDGKTSPAILRAVDTALYRAKHAGSGQVIAAN
jgi:diguanylate cyclase (GGDEF)-like protein